jgi:hypothetical protein
LLEASSGSRTTQWLGGKAGLAASEAAGLALLLGLAAWIFLIPFHTATNYDEGNYLAALTDLRHGYALGTDVYADQPPGWYGLLQLLASIFGNSLAGIRAGLLLISLAGVAAAWGCARVLGPLPAFGAAALLIVAPPYPAQATQIEADTAAASIALVALALAAWAFRGRGSAGLAVAAGGVLASAISVKLSASTAAVPFLALGLFRRKLIPWAALGAAAVVAAELIAYSDDLGAIAHGAIGQHTSALGSSQWSRGANVHRLIHFLNWHTPFAWLVLAAVIATVWLALRGAGDMRRLGGLWLFAPAAAAFILAMKPLLDHHLVILAVAVALPAGAALGLAGARVHQPAQAALALAAIVFAIAGIYQQHRQLVRSETPEPYWIHRAADWLRVQAAPDDVVATDIPIIAYYSHRRLVPDFVDSSFTRLGVGELTPVHVAAQLDRYHVSVAAIGRVFWADKGIRTVFDRRFRKRETGPNIVLYSVLRRP